MQINGKELTQAQKDALKTWDAAAVGTDSEKVALLNSLASPSYKAWRSFAEKHATIEEPDVDSVGGVTGYLIGGGTGSFIDRSQGERDGWHELWNSQLKCRPHQAQTRIALFDIYSGAAAIAQSNRRHVWARWQRQVTVGEKLFVTATVGGPKHDASNGNNPAGQTGARGSWTNPDTLTIEGPFQEQDLVNARS